MKTSCDTFFFNYLKVSEELLALVVFLFFDSAFEV